VCGERVVGVVGRGGEGGGGRAGSVGVSQGAYVDRLGTAVHGVGRRIAGTLGDVVRLDGLDEHGVLRIALGVQDVDARRIDGRRQKIAALHVGVGSVRA